MKKELFIYSFDWEPSPEDKVDSEAYQAELSECKAAIGRAGGVFECAQKKGDNHQRFDLMIPIATSVIGAIAGIVGTWIKGAKDRRISVTVKKNEISIKANNAHQVENLLRAAGRAQKNMASPKTSKRARGH
ncbi:hypothetical protein [Burkholderia sp. Ac-20379]|uniref:hypothetical protein n=1 Tax=Burkholderia sp. Ac-20379 TaxID=2703900 RepID=UPI001981C05B|nr:hypothetical protein [Burkholderia sp. Ac-20379]MBN3723265.1 hypothetical protein [Burkholderia sp. Ac-20379]